MMVPLLGRMANGVVGVCRKSERNDGTRPGVPYGLGRQGRTGTGRSTRGECQTVKRALPYVHKHPQPLAYRGEVNCAGLRSLAKRNEFVTTCLHPLFFFL